MKKYNREIKKYDSYQIPLHWKCVVWENNMNTIINCANCGKEIIVGSSYNSQEIFEDNGWFSYLICFDCYQQEYERKRQMESRYKND